MPNLKKLLSRFSGKEREIITSLLEKIISLDWHGLDVKKLKGHENVFRVRRGSMRIVFTKDNKNVFVVAIERRRENTYKF